MSDHKDDAIHYIPADLAQARHQRNFEMPDYMIDAATKEEWAARAFAAEAKLAKAVEEIEELRASIKGKTFTVLSDDGEAWKARAEAAEAKANVMVADKINLRSELLSVEAKLAKAVEALGRIEVASQNFAQPEMPELACRYAHETTRRLARAALAEIGGEKP